MRIDRRVEAGWVEEEKEITLSLFGGLEEEHEICGEEAVEKRWKGKGGGVDKRSQNN